MDCGLAWVQESFVHHALYGDVCTDMHLNTQKRPSCKGLICEMWVPLMASDQTLEFKLTGVLLVCF